MNQNNILFTAGQFARLHHLNKRTLHYYDDIGLFSPARKGSNGYRYYTYYQSTELENILSLRELGMSIEEIKRYREEPSSHSLLALSGKKIEELKESIRRMEALKSILEKKQELLRLSMDVKDGQTDLFTCEEEYLAVTPLSANAQLQDNASQMETLLHHLQSVWDLSEYKSGCGSLISVEKIMDGEFSQYDGLFTEMEDPQKAQEIHIKPAGLYVRGFCIGSWEKIPLLYGDMIKFARKNRLELHGYAYETGLNEAALKDMEEYVTQILIPCREI